MLEENLSGMSPPSKQAHAIAFNRDSLRDSPVLAGHLSASPGHTPSHPTPSNGTSSQTRPNSSQFSMPTPYSTPYSPVPLNPSTPHRSTPQRTFSSPQPNVDPRLHAAASLATKDAEIARLRDENMRLKTELTDVKTKFRQMQQIVSSGFS